ncbi:MAG: hypothetical protein ACYSO4_06935 [Planctomycetota bacterium]|jgi:hypothetical protein
MSQNTCENHDQHLCKLYGAGTAKDAPDQYAHLVRDPQFVCKSCGRVAAKRDNLCDPTPLGVWEE